MTKFCWQCGVRKSKRHGGRWHEAAQEAMRLHARRVPFAEIGRRLGLTRAYVQQRIRGWGR